jgi:2-(1,2-epoxy-1,2-dihydrophenyl)acetyl-CoA isomerase
VSDIVYTLDGGVAVLRLNRPETLNAFTTKMADETFPALCREMSEDPAVRVVVLTGTGRGFCSGADVRSRLSELDGDSASLQRPLGAFVAEAWRIPKPVVAAVNGVAAGGGLSLAAVADFRVAGASARFTPAFIRRGLMPDGGLTHTLPRLVGRAKALELLMTASATLDAEEALRIGLADRVVPDEELMDAAFDLARGLAAGPPVALSFTKRALQRAGDYEAQLEFESWGQRVCLRTEDFDEGRRAFTEHREPEFRGR